MARLNISRVIIFLTIIVMPISYATKYLLNLPNVVWIDPALILALILFMLCHVTIIPKVSSALLIFPFISACVGYFILPTAAIYDVFREPLRLAMNFILFWVCVWFFERRKKLLVNFLALSVIIQFGVATLLWLALNGWLPLSLPDVFVGEFQSKQQVWLGDFVFQRFMGTFWEGPPFGLFMFSCFVIFFLTYIVDGERTLTVNIGLWTAGLGVAASLADQVFLGLAFFIVPAVLLFLKNNRYIVWGLLGCLIVAMLLPYTIGRLGEKYQEITTFGTENVLGMSGGERAYHIKNGLNIIADNPLVLITGIGPGRYGDYAAATGVWSRLVTMQVTAVEWLVEYGILWTSLMLIFLWIVGRHGFQRYGWYGLSSFTGLMVANMFQANWKWEAWFVALAFLYSASNVSPLKISQNKQKQVT